MAKQLTDLNEILGNFVGDGDYLLIRDISDKEDKKIKVEELGNALFLSQHRIGSVYITYSEDDNPNSRGGEWVLASVGRSIVGVDPSDADFNSADKQGGEKKHKMTINELVSHNHPITRPPWRTTERSAGGDTHAPNGTYRWFTQSTDGVGGIGKTGDGEPFNVMHPWETAFIWRRTS